MKPLPKFTYHPDPIATGSIAESAAECLCCGKARGYIYLGPVYAEDELDEAICPWCIANGSAAEKFEAVFVDDAAIGKDDEVPPEVVEEISQRTPGFSAWQQERWLACCDDGALFLGPMGRAELEPLGPAAFEAVQADCGMEGADWEAYKKTLNRDQGPTAYVFRCLHCSKLLAYTDCH